MDAAQGPDRYRRSQETRYNATRLGDAMSSDSGSGLVGRSASVMNAEEVLEEARRALFVMVGFIALIWTAQVVNWALSYRLTNHYAIEPRSVVHLGDVFSA